MFSFTRFDLYRFWSLLFCPQWCAVSVPFWLGTASNCLLLFIVHYAVIMDWMFLWWEDLKFKPKGTTIRTILEYWIPSIEWTRTSWESVMSWFIRIRWLQEVKRYGSTELCYEVDCKWFIAIESYTILPSFVLVVYRVESVPKCSLFEYRHNLWQERVRRKTSICCSLWKNVLGRCWNGEFIQ